MQRKHPVALAALFGISLLIAFDLRAQAPPDTPPAAPAGGRAGRAGRGGRGAAAAAGAVGASGTAAAGRGGGGGGAYPSRPPADPAIAAAGKAIYEPNCAKCHAADLRGAAGGINLVRNQMNMDDQDGELIGKFLQSPHAKGQAPKMDLNATQVHDLAIYMHTFMNYRGVVIPPDTNGAILALGKPAAGETYFKAHCASCHSVTGDLKGIGSKYSDPKTMQNTLVSGGGGGGRGGGRGGPVADGTPASRRTITATVTLANGTKVEGRPGTYDDFLITLTEADGTEHSWRKSGDFPKIEIHDPMKAHHDLLLVLTDDDIHNLTTYLLGVK